MQLVDLVDLVSKGGLLTFLVIVLWGGWRGWYVWKYVYETRSKELQERIKEITDDRNYWREQAIKTLQLGRGAVSVAEKQTTKPID